MMRLLRAAMLRYMPNVSARACTASAQSLFSSQEDGSCHLIAAASAGLVSLAFVMPANSSDDESPMSRKEHASSSSMSHAPTVPALNEKLLLAEIQERTEAAIARSANERKQAAVSGKVSPVAAAAAAVTASSKSARPRKSHKVRHYANFNEKTDYGENSLVPGCSPSIFEDSTLRLTDETSEPVAKRKRGGNNKISEIDYRSCVRFGCKHP